MNVTGMTSVNPRNMQDMSPAMASQDQKIDKTQTPKRVGAPEKGEQKQDQQLVQKEVSLERKITKDDSLAKQNIDKNKQAISGEKVASKFQEQIFDKKSEISKISFESRAQTDTKNKDVRNEAQQQEKMMLAKQLYGGKNNTAKASEKTTSKDVASIDMKTGELRVEKFVAPVPVTEIRASVTPAQHTHFLKDLTAKFYNDASANSSNGPPDTSSIQTQSLDNMNAQKTELQTSEQFVATRKDNPSYAMETGL